MTSDQKMIKIGDIRDALIIYYKGKKFLDIGINKLFQYFGKMKSGTRIAIQIKTTQPELTVKEISKEDIKDYWGYRCKRKGQFTFYFINMERQNNPNFKKRKKFYYIRHKKNG